MKTNPNEKALFVELAFKALEFKTRYLKELIFGTVDVKMFWE